MPIRSPGCSNLRLTESYQAPEFLTRCHRPFIVMAGLRRIGVRIATPVAFVSWPAPRAVPAARPTACLCRPSTTLPHPAPPVVDGRAWPHRYQDQRSLEEGLAIRSSTCAATDGPDKPGHDDKAKVRLRPAPYRGTD